MSNLDLKILCVDDETGILELYDFAVRKAGFTPILCNTPEDAIAQFKANMESLVLVLSDFQMPKMNGFDFRKALLPDGLLVPFVVVSSHVTKEMALTALDLKIAAFVDKPVDEVGIVAIINKDGKPRLDLIRETQALTATFIDEATAILEEMDPVLLSIDHDRSNQDSINLVFRGAHTIKGSSGILSTDIVTRYVHKYEDIISGVKKGQIEFSDDVYEVLLKGFDRIRELIAAVTSKEISKFKLADILPELSLAKGTPITGGAAVKSQEPAVSKTATVTQKPKDTISVPINMLDELSGFSGEITVIRNMVNKLVKSLERRYSGNKEIQSLGELLDEMHKINSTIQTRITDLRKVPLTGVLKPIPRIIRDLSRDLGKSIKLVIEGETLRVDNSLATVCSNSLVHLVRNSADHGIEPPAERVAAGKAEGGTVIIKCTESRDEVVISISDDGRGIDPQKIRAKALEKNLYTPAQLNDMSEQQILGIIFASGFSTAAKVTDVSGRGVGMDMVRSSVEVVGGQILIESRVGLGSTFHMRLPIPKSVLIINSLLVEAAGRSFAVPQDAIIRVIRIEPKQFGEMLQSAASGLVLRCDDELFPLVTLRDLLQIGGVTPVAPAAATTEVIEVLILKSENAAYALRVDGISDSEEIVVKRIQSYFNPRGVFGGATFMGDGTVGLILDVNGIADLSGIKSNTLAKDTSKAKPPEQGTAKVGGVSARNYLLFQLGSKALFGVPLEQVFRLEEIDHRKVQRSGAERVVVYRDGIMPILSVEKLLKLSAVGPTTTAKPQERIPTIVAKGKDGYFGLEVSTVVDIATSDSEVSDTVRDRRGVVGNAFIRDHNVTILDLPTVLGHPVGQ